MSSSNYRFTLNMQDEQSQVSLPVRYGDTDRKLYISFADGGKPFFIENGYTAWFIGKKSDGMQITTSCEIEKNSAVCYEFTTQTTSRIGIVDCEIRLYDKEGKLVTSPRFIMVVDDRVIGESQVESEDYVTVLDKLLGTESTVSGNEADRVEAEKTRQSQEDSRQETFENNESSRQTSFETSEASRQSTFESNESNRQSEFDDDEASRESTFGESERLRSESFESAEASRQFTFEKNEDIRISNETERIANEEARATAENSRVYDESQRVSAESARARAETLREIAETSRENYESTRRTAEQYRIEDENKRNTAEKERASAETERLASEETRIINEDVRISNETERIANDKVREDSFANAIKVTEIGETVRVDDVSPCTHNVKCKVKSNSNINLASVQVTRCGKNLIPYPYYKNSQTTAGGTFTVVENGGISGSGTPVGYCDMCLYQGKPLADSGEITISLLGTHKNMVATLAIYDSAENPLVTKTCEENSVKLNLDELVSPVKWVILIKRKTDNVEMSGIAYVQIEQGDTATEYEPYKGETFTPLSDGTVDGIKSVSPTMTLFTDTAGVEIEIEYNRDSNQLADKKLSSTSVHPVQNKIITDNFARVDNEFDALKRRVDSIDEVSKGAVEAKSFMTYADMLAEINAESKDRYKVGQHFIIQAIGVPDLYIYGVSDTSSTYVYTNDKAVVDATTAGYVQVGYYLISQLETQTVDLTDYAKKDQVPVILASQKENGAYTLTIKMGVE